MPKVGMQPIRRQQLIKAAFDVIVVNGVEDATMAAVANAAGMSTGIVSHYFGSKDGLLEAAMRQVLRDLRDAVATHRAQAKSDDPRAHLRAIVDGNFDPSQTNPTAMRVWLSFWAASRHKPELARLQRANDRRLHSNLAYQFSRLIPRADARDAATGLAAMIDGLWLRGSLSNQLFDPAHARALTYEIIDLYLSHRR
ncbi:transcriptional regulator BetI [Novosphingobium flavum]|uniref:HTH-type transcriptional regulator BetI n=1 Tax=Novosphingobium aerophilum TaxID=2839843 RepID=A0A7X1F9B7_9SPHN|nr:transcriptional regulator BetI [Novosphingobium aerophilum]MBC2652785.1 transcriptional regulator BetI [Novosphingobium aerophilum]MBC2660824.1 transcriptional regulator BetI [Novosphingobium aerophilum]